MSVEPPNPNHLRLKAATAIVTVALTAGLLLFDWDAATGGHPNVFSSVRPSLKAALNRLYGRDGAAAAQQQHVGRPGDGSSGATGS